MNEISENLFDGFGKWRVRNMSDKSFVIFLSLLTGILAGFAAYLIKLGVDFLTKMLYVPLSPGTENWEFIVYPVVGFILVYAFQKYVARQNLAHGTEQIADRLKNKDYKFKRGSAISSIIGAVLTLGTGGSAGDEGPSAYSGAVVGSGIGRFFRVDSKVLSLLIGIGAGAGIAAIFKAPIGGMLFTLEVLGLELTTMTVLALITSCLVAALTTYILLGCTPDIILHYQNTLNSGSIVFVVLFGLFCGLYSMYYCYSGRQCANLLGRVKNNWVKSAVAGLSVAVMVFFFPTLYGPGYGALNKIINIDLTSVTQYSIFASIEESRLLIVIIAFGIIALKGMACYITNNGNGVAGDFAPTLFAGGFVGLFFAGGLNLIFDLNLSVSNFVFLGMAGVMAGIIRAPLMAIFLTAEMTCTFDFLLPATVVSILSYGVVNLAPVDSQRLKGYVSRKVDKYRKK